jgi:hypothetical protein
MGLIDKIDVGVKRMLLEDSRKELFFKALYLFVLIKLWVSWSTLELIIEFVPAREYSRVGLVLHAPLQLITFSVGVFVLVFSLILLTSLVVRLNYISAFLIFWFSVCLSKFLFPVLNGADLVLNLFLLIGLVTPTFPVLKWRGIAEYQKVISAFGVLFVKVEIALIYFLSGYDKLITAPWRNGNAIFSIANLDYFSNPNFSIQLSGFSALVVAWLVILFEISFAFFIWFKKFRNYWLIAGVVFHLTIIVFMGLLDFGLVMIISYLIFLPAKKLASVQSS